MRILATGVIALLVASYLRAAETVGPLEVQGSMRQKIDVSKLGPQVGEKVPDFSLKDQTGKLRTLSSVMGPRGAMLVFFRSADW